MRIILLEFIDEVQALIKLYGKEFFLDTDTITICIHPKARAYLKNLGIHSQDTLPYLDNEAQNRIILKSEQLTVKLVEELRFKDDFGFEKGYRETCIHHVRFYINYFLWIIELLKGIFEKHGSQVEAVYACIPLGQVQCNSRLGYIQDRERYLGVMTKEYCLIKDVNFIPAKMVLQQEPFWERCAAAFARQLLKVFFRIHYKILARRDYKNHDVVIVPGLSYRMDLLLKDIKNRYPQVKAFMIWEGGESFRRQLAKSYMTLTHLQKKWKRENLLESIIHLDFIKGDFRLDPAIQKNFSQHFDALLAMIDSGFKEECHYEGITIAPYLKEKVGGGLKQEILNLQHSTYCLSEIFKKFKPRLLISMYSAGIFYMMGELANYYHFPALNISHGTHVPPNNEFERIENYRLSTSVIMNTYPIVAVQTPWAEKFLDYYGDRRKRILTGPLLYSEINRSEREALLQHLWGHQSNRKIIVHAATQKPRYGLRFHITESLDEYIAALADIVGVVNNLKDVYLIIRPHPSCNLSEEEFRLLLPDSTKVKVLGKGPFSRILSASDLMISYSSTCIEEATQNGVPVLLYDKWKRYNHFNIGEIDDPFSLKKQPSYYLTHSDLLKPTLEKLLTMFPDPSFAGQEIPEYKYPKNYRTHFTQFVDQALNGGIPQ